MRRRSLSVSLLLVSALVVAFTPLAPAAGTTPVPTGNLTSNPSFETNANGWAPWQSTLTRTALTDAPNGSYAMKVARASGTYYTIDDAPDTVPNATAGTNYTATAYVKAAVTASVGKPIRIVVRERKVVNGALVKETSSTAVNLTTAFQKITVTHTGVKSGEAVDMYVQQDGAVSGNAFYVDLISLTAGAPAPPPDTQAPSAPAGLTLGAVTATSAPLSWTAATDNVGVTGYQVSLNGVAGATVTGTSYAFTGLSCGTTYTLGVRARDAAGNLSTAATRSATTGACPDTQAPSAPTALTAGAVTPTSIPLGWAASTDDVGVTGYQVSLNGVAGATVTGTGYTFTGLTCGTTYTLGVRARDAAGNYSDPATATAQTADCPDTQAPSMPANLVSGTVSDTSIPLSWDAATDDVGVTGYQVSLNGVPGATVTATGYAFTGLSCGTTYTLGVRARDAAGNLSAAATASVATSACPVDTQPPSVPTALSVGTPTATGLPLSWAPAIDDVGVTGYQVSLNGVDGATVTGTGYTFTGLTCGTTYTLGVRARDAAGNYSDPATATAQTADCPDTQAPSMPANLVSGTVSDTSIPLSWDAATDDVGVTGYQVSLNGVPGATVTATGYAFTGLSCGTTYTLGVRARDAAGNLSAAATASVATGACPPPPPGVTVPAGNLTANPSFETNTAGWGPWQATVARVAQPDAPVGAYVAKVTRAAGAYYTIDDSPDTVPNATGGTTYTAVAYVKAAAAQSVGKPVRIVVRERKTVNGALVKETSSSAVNLSNAYQMVTVSGVAVTSGEAVDMYVQQDGAVANDSFYVDAISLVPGTAAPPTNPPPPVSNPDMYGVSYGYGLQNLSDADLNRTLSDWTELGVKWVRFDFDWSLMQPNGPTVTNFAPWDRVVTALGARGIKVLGIIDYTPSWACGCNDTKMGPTDPTNFGNFAVTLAQHYAPMGVHSWDIWNEPNNLVFWHPAPNIANYTALLKATAPRIRAADPQAFILNGGFSPASDDGRNIAPITFLKGMYAAGARSSFDAVNDHPYAYPFGIQVTQQWSAWYQMFGTTPDSLRSVMIANGDADKKIWMTEVGAPTGGNPATQLTEAQQAQLLTDTYNAAKTFPWSGPVFWYSYWDRGTNPNDVEDHFGLVRNDYTRKPSFDAYKAEAHS